MKIRYLKFKRWLVASLMGALGLSSCGGSRSLPEREEGGTPELREREEMRLMYGVPTMDYRIQGRVKDAQGRPVGNLRVNMLERGMAVEGGQLQGDPEKVDQWLEQTGVSTDKEGRFELRHSGLPQEQVRLLVRDVDGVANGEHGSRLVEVEVDEVDRTQAQGMYQGSFSRELDINLEGGK